MATCPGEIPPCLAGCQRPEDGLSSPRVKPDPTKHNPAPEYIRALISRAGLSQREAARRVGISARSMRHYCTGKMVCPYSVQYALENLTQ